AASGSMSGHNATTVLTGNPTRNTGFFYDTHNRLRDDWQLESPKDHDHWPCRRESTITGDGIERLLSRDSSPFDGVSPA
ncbi:MAG: hypothetical protein ACPHJ3_11180, partial [Rubripirellula sp.]